MEKILNYDNLIPLQGRKLKEIDVHEIVDAVIKAGEAEDYNNAMIALKDDNDRLGENYVSFAYEISDGSEFVNIDTQKGHYSIPVINSQVNYKNVDRRLNHVIKDFGEKEIYIDMPYINEEEPFFEEDVLGSQEGMNNFIETDVVELEYISSLVREQITEIKEYGSSSVDYFDTFLKEFLSNSQLNGELLNNFQDKSAKKAEIVDISPDKLLFTQAGLDYAMNADGSIYEISNGTERYVAEINTDFLTQDGQFVSNTGKIQKNFEKEHESSRVNELIADEELKVEENPDEKVKEPIGFDSVVINKKRTQLESDISIDLKDTADRLRAEGYEVRTKQGGSLLVTDTNLSKENTITITKKNAYIETANLTTSEAEIMYNKMRNSVVDAMQQSLNMTKESYDLIESSPKLGEVPAQIVVISMMYRFELDKMNKDPDYADVFSEPERRYTFKDPSGKEYMTISMGYSVKEDEQNRTDKTVMPVIVAKYGPDYGNISRTFNVTEKDMEAYANNKVYQSDIAKAMDEFAAIGTKDRSSIFKEIQNSRYEEQLDKIFNYEFKKLNPEKKDFFSDKAKEYFRKEIGKKEISLTDYMLKELPKAPFFRESMLKNEESLRKMFQDIEKKLDSPDLSKLKLEKISMDRLNYTIEEGGVKTYNSAVKGTIAYDREWITKLVTIVDKLNDIKNGPVQDMLDTAKSMAKGVNEARQGIVKFYKDGIYSGFEFGSGIHSFGEGLTYGHVLHNLEKEYMELAKSKNKNDQLAAIDKKMDIKIYRDEIMRNADIYTKAATSIRNNIDKMIDVVQSLRIQAEISDKSKRPFINSTFIDQANEYFKKLGSNINENFKKLVHSIQEINKNVMAFGVKRIQMLPEAFHAVQAQTSYNLNCFREGYNEAVINAKVNLSSKEYSKNQIARMINDTRLLQACKVESGELSKVMQGRLWDELDSSIKKGHEAEKIAPEDRNSEEVMAVNYGKQAQRQKEQNLFIAERLNDKIKDTILKERQMTLTEAVERLAVEYHNAAMAYSVMNGASTMKTYEGLSQSEKAECCEIMKVMLDNMPSVKEKLEHNMEQDLQKEEVSPQAGLLDKVGDEEKRDKNSFEIGNDGAI